MQLWELFLSAFISSTIAPGGSEAVLAYMVAKHLYGIEPLLLVATMGNTLGAMTTWYLGYLAACKFPVESMLKGRQQKALLVVRDKGIWVLLFSWLPVVGDAFCFAAGWLKLPLLTGFGLITLGKFFRYCVVVWIFI
jgi:membrane protein YqaA with SNARE-associated domain